MFVQVQIEMTEYNSYKSIQVTPNEIPATFIFLT